MVKLNAISYFDIHDYTSILKQIEDGDYKIYYIDGRYVSTIEEFCDSIRDILPLNPMLTGRVNLDAFTDSLSEGVYYSEYNKIAIVLKNPEELMKEERFGELIDCIREVTEELTQENIVADDFKLTTLRIFIFMSELEEI